jgi:subfamily B ATP-binding cassette protein MsbA
MGPGRHGDNGARQIFAGTMTLAVSCEFYALLAFLVAPMFQVVAIGTQVTEALAGLPHSKFYGAS